MFDKIVDFDSCADKSESAMKLSLLINVVKLLEDTLGPGISLILNATLSIRHPVAEKFLGRHPFWGM